ncbi:uncharacterized protein LOC117373607 [Periophthalmus magnuspinnatus]|uniref:uncharacterized protein LOC117373607 n=1 Tax=Periophthalmus magnuspinnatus TaxID=409849 RepID=UPI0024364ABA|nr:uncharacterized protein LOC117373607 [Periophthalmus magnuspinnatus]
MFLRTAKSLNTTVPALYCSTRRPVPEVCLTRRMSSGPRHVVWSSKGAVAYLSTRPWTPGSVVVEPSLSGAEGGSVFELPEEAYLSLLLGARGVSRLLCERLGVHRCALVARPQPHRPPQVQVLPLHGLDAEWCPHLAADEEFNPTDPGYCTSKSAPRWSEERLTELQGQIRAMLPDPLSPPDYTFLGEDPAHPGLFSRIVRGEELQWRVWDDPGHVAFLTPFPNTPGLTVVVPRRPLPSDIFSLEEQDYVSLVQASRSVALLLLRSLAASAVGMIFEGFEINYAHVKLMPLFSSCSSRGEQIGARAAPFYSIYPGFVSSEDGPEASAHSLKELHAQLTC